jgi:hypothetical protein
LLLLAFGLATVWSVEAFGALPLSRPPLLALATGTAAFLVSLLWFFLLALRRGVGWSLGMLIPYVNLIVATRFARRFWSEGARAPVLLLWGGIALQMVGWLGLLFVRSPVLV